MTVSYKKIDRNNYHECGKCSHAALNAINCLFLEAWLDRYKVLSSIKVSIGGLLVAIKTLKFGMDPNLFQLSFLSGSPRTISVSAEQHHHLDILTSEGTFNWIGVENLLLLL